MNKSDFYYEENVNRIKQALLKDFKELLVPEFTTGWKTEIFFIELYIKIMSLDNTMKVILKGGE